MRGLDPDSKEPPTSIPGAEWTRPRRRNGNPGFGRGKRIPTSLLTSTSKVRTSQTLKLDTNPHLPTQSQNVFYTWRIGSPMGHI